MTRADELTQIETAVKRANFRGLLFWSGDALTQEACEELAQQGRAHWVPGTATSVGGWIWTPPAPTDLTDREVDEINSTLSDLSRP